MRKELTFKEALRAAKGMGENTIIVDLLLENYQEAEETICRWLYDHPLKTRKSVLLEKYPDAPILNGKPNFCCRNIGYEISDKDYCRNDCYECWNQPIDEEAIK